MQSFGKAGVGGLVGVLLIVLSARCCLGAEATPTGLLDRQQQAKLKQLSDQMYSAVSEGEFGAAAKAAGEIVALRERWQGKGHWQTVDARWKEKRWQSVVRLSAKDQKQVALSLQAQSKGNFLASRLKYQDAEQLFRKALSIRLMVLGEEHPETAQGYNNVASNLNARGKYAEAQPLFQKALDVRRKVLGEEHPDTATSYNNVAGNLNAQGKYAEAQPLFQKALDIRRKVLGEEHPDTATGYDNVAMNLNARGKHVEAQPLHQKALDIRRKVLGEEHPDTATSYNNVAANYQAQDKYAEAQPLFQKALDIFRKVLGEEHPDTATGYNSVAFNLNAQGKYAAAQPLHQKALTIFRKLLGEDHPSTAGCYNNLAVNLNAQGKYAEAQPLFQRALAIRRKVLGEEHPDTAASYNSVAVNLDDQGKHAEAQPLYQKALTARRKVLGEEHPDTAASYNSVAFNLNTQGKYGEAQPLFEKALAIFRKVLGEKHPSTATSYNNVASNLNAQGKYREAQPLYQKALDIWRKVLGDDHPATATGYNNVAGNLWQQDQVAAAVRLLQPSLPGQEAARFHHAPSGFDRAVAVGQQLSPRAMLAVGLARLGQPALAFVHAEAGLARGLLDDLAIATPAEMQALQQLAAQRERLDQQLLPLFAKADLSDDQNRRKSELLDQRRDVQDRHTRLAAALSARQLLSLAEIQKQLPAHAALVLWIDIDSLGEHHACIVRSRGDPVWVRLSGSERDGNWSQSDRTLADRLYRLLRQPNPRDAERQRLTEALAKQRFEPLRPYLGVRGQLPMVERLLVVPVGWVARVPLEALSTGYQISYIPSGSIYARLKQKHRAVEGSSLLALGDPVFTPPTPKQPKLPSSGVLVTFVQPGGGAARAGLRSGDVLVQMGEIRLESVDDLKKALARGGHLRYWHQGVEQDTDLPKGPLGIRIDPRPAPQSVRAWQEAETSSVRGRPAPASLPGTRWEVQSIARLVSRSTSLLGSDASEQRLYELAQAGKLKEYRLLHLATHGIIHDERPEGSALLMARDRLPDPLEQVRQGKPVYTGELRVQAIRQRKEWQLDADLVTLSACKTALGKDTSGDGLLGFAQAFLQKGAHAVLLSRWSADDTATALLMLRFYENLLGKRSGLKKPLPRAEALAEASQWLRQLRRSDALVLASRLSGGKLSHTTRGTEEEWTVAGSADKLPVPAGDRPYAHPAYWAAFVLVGDPD